MALTCALERAMHWILTPSRINELALPPLAIVQRDVREIVVPWDRPRIPGRDRRDRCEKGLLNPSSRTRQKYLDLLLRESLK